MMKLKHILVPGLLAATGIVAIAAAAELTPLGAEKAANAAGTIPA